MTDAQRIVPVDTSNPNIHALQMGLDAGKRDLPCIVCGHVGENIIFVRWGQLPFASCRAHYSEISHSRERL